MKSYIMSAGYSTRFRLAGYTKPRYLLPIKNKKTIEHIIKDMPTEEVECIFRHHIFFDFYNQHSDIATKYTTKLIMSNTANVVETSIRSMDENENDIFISYNDFILQYDKEKFKNFCLTGKYDAVVVCVKKENCITKGDVIFGTVLRQGDTIIEVAEKQQLIDKDGNIYIITGLFYFKNSNIYLEYATKALERYKDLEREIYITDIVKIMLKEGSTVGIYESDKVYCLGTPDDYELSKEILEK